MEVDAFSADEPVVQAFPSVPSLGSVNVSQTTRHQHSENCTGIPSLLSLDLTGPDPLHLNSSLSPTTPPMTSILGKRKRSPSPSQFLLESGLPYPQAEPTGRSTPFEEDDEALTKAIEEAGGGRRCSLRWRDGEFHPYTDYLRMWVGRARSC